MSAREIAAALEFAASLMPEAGRIALAHFRRPIAVDDKRSDGRFDPVTEADRAIEALLVERIRARYPDHGIVGEEHGSHAGSSRWSWIIDPIDGTRAFISGVPAWGTLLGLRLDGEPVAGLVHQPYLGETFAGSAEGGWFEHAGQRRALATRADARLADATLYCTHPSMFANAANLAAFERVAARVRLARFGGDCYSWCLLALGCIDLVIEDTLQPYDIQPLIPLVASAGGVVTHARGGPATAGGFVIGAANPGLHAEALALLGAAP
jgi:myo-inositol-1(or 4)-monophosphatase